MPALCRSAAAEGGEERRRARKALLRRAWKMAPRLYVAERSRTYFSLHFGSSSRVNAW